MKISINRTDLETARLEKAMIKDYGEIVHAIGNSGTAVTLDFSTGNVFTYTQNGNIASFTYSNVPTALDGSTITVSMTLIITHDATATSYTTTWTGFKWANGTAPSLTQSASAIDIVTAFSADGGTTWYGFNPGLKFS